MRIAVQQELDSYHKIQDEPDIQSAIIELISKNGRWRGASTELSDILGLNINPRALSVQLKNQNTELENLGISVRRVKSHGRHVIIITSTHELAHSETKDIHPIQTKDEHNDFATPPEKEPITFPFSWQYGTITRLSKKERTEVNGVRHQGRKKYQKPCSGLCGREGVLEFRKVSDGNSSLICKSCATQYVLNAIKLQENGVGEMM